MNLYIKLLNGRPVDHPITEDNMRSAHPHVTLYNLPDDWAEFVRVPSPRLGPYETAECHYEWDGLVVKDTWYVYQMGSVEKAQKQQRVKTNYSLDGGFPNWVFDEEKCCHVPPVPYPQDGKTYIWIQQANKWVDITVNAAIPATIDPTLTNDPPLPPPYPTDGKQYQYVEASNSWVLKTNTTVIPPEYPADGKNYQYHLGSNSWIP